MNSHTPFGVFRVNILALCMLISIPGCTFIDRQYGESCKSRAHLRQILPDYINTRYNSGSPVRLAVVPYSTPANLAATNTERPGLGNTFAWRLQTELLDFGEIPIIEVFNRQDWPGKKEEFFTGNHQGIRLAREAGYDLVVLGYIEPPTSTNGFTAHTKVIETDSGVTIYYGQSSAWTDRRNLDKRLDSLWLSDREPAKMHLDPVIDKLADCVADQIMSTES